MGMAVGGHVHASPVMSVNSTALALANAITGGNVTVLGATLTTNNVNQAGTFSTGTSSVGFASGVVLSTGNITQIPGANSNVGAETYGSSVFGTGQISTAYNTGASNPGAVFDSAQLTVTFQFGNGSVGGSFGVHYVFASEEYINYAGTTYNDDFAFLLDGVNIALLPGTSTGVAIDNVNPTTNSSLYINNVANTNGYPVAGRDFQFDGLTTVLTASASNLSAGSHTMTFRVRDISDGQLDSAVFVQAGSFSTDTPATSVPEPGTLVLAGAALAGLGVARRRACTRV
jgi:hypothetical protein